MADWELPYAGIVELSENPFSLGPVYIRSGLTRNLQLGYFRTNVNISN